VEMIFLVRGCLPWQRLLMLLTGNGR